MIDVDEVMATGWQEVVSVINETTGADIEFKEEK